MRLELDILNIKDVQFAEKTAISDGVLHINRQELQELLQEDRRLSQVAIDLAHPGEKCRILQVSDVFEPRAKTGGSGEDFPGALGKQGTVGEGSTCVLRGAAVVISDYSESRELSLDPNGEIIDVSGPAAELGIYGETHNVVLLPSPANGVNLYDYRVAAKTAGLKTAVYLAKAGKEQKPDEIEVYDLPSLTEIAKGLEDLPKVAYVFQVLSAQFEAVHEDPVLYGNNALRIVPTILHPNEILDGAIVAPYRAWGVDTYVIQNHPIIRELYRRHGKDLCFVGVIVTIAHDNEPANETAATMVANLAKWVLGADGVILTKSGGGAPEPAIAQTAQRCEELGVKSALALWHIAADISDASFDARVVFNFPGLDAIVSMGIPWEEIILPPVERVIGKPFTSPAGLPVSGEFKNMVRWIRGGQDQLGTSRQIASRY